MALQASTQIDGLGHFGGPHDTFFNGFWAGLVTTRSGARRLGVHHVAAHGLVGRAVLLDVARHYGADRLMPGTPIGPDELDATAAAQNVTVAAGDIVLVRTGHLGWEMSGAKAGHDAPGLSARAIPWLAEHDVAMVGLDTSAIEVVPADVDTAPFPFHIGALRDLGLMLGELFDLDELAADCAADGVYEGMFIASALPVVNAVGSPINPIVIK
jgi:kynurenine formamidase